MNSHETIRWGILSTGTIAHSFAEGLRHVPDAALVAVGSRTQTAAERFAREFDVPRSHGSYAALAHDPDVDVIYVATPHTFHAANTRLCLEAGKAVLCEKPFALNAREARSMIELARARGLFLMEAMWTRFLPAIVKLRELLAAGAIGEVRMVAADFGFRTALDPESRLLDPALGGGALLDVGVYPLSLASMILGAPARVTGLAHLGETGVDEQSAAVLAYEGGRLATIYAAVRTQTPVEATVMGTRGSIRILNPMYCPDRLILTRDRLPGVSGTAIPPGLKRLGRALGLTRVWRWLKGRQSGGTTMRRPYRGNGYNYEAAEVGHCLRAGQLESDIMPLDETLAIMQTMDELRAQWGLRYPGELGG